MRYEFKYVISHLDFQQLRSKIMLHPAGFQTAFPDRTINSQYFDDFKFTAAIDNMSGNPKRMKYRIRWYGELIFPKKAVLEQKIKSANLGYKVSNKMILNSLDDLKTTSLESAHLVPVSFVSYLRSYFISFDKKVRVTIDQHVCYRKFPDDDYVVHDDNIILEVKSDEDSVRDLETFLDGLQMRRHKNSKYTRSIVALYT